jgi:hypothetical protein
MELLVVLCLLAILITLGIPAFKSFFIQWEASGGVRTVTTGLSYARYDAVKMNRSVKFCIEDNQILLKEKRSGVWEPFRSFDVEKNVSLTINSSPVFSPTGSVAPLCSIYVENERYRYKITISIAGRIKVVIVES